MLNLLPLNKGILTLKQHEGRKSTVLDPAQHMAFCPESGAVFADISVESYLKLWCRIKHRNPQYYRRAPRDYLEELDLSPLLSKLGRQLSKGQRRRVQTAVGFLIAPKLFLFDEPFDGLDVQQTNKLTELIRSHERDMTFVISSHRMDVVERLADYVIVLGAGEVCAHGDVTAVCRTLAGESVVIDVRDASASLAHRLQAKLPQHIVTQIGPQIFITGHTSDHTLLSRLITQEHGVAVPLEKRSPRLVDAMTYHLQLG